MNRTVDPASLPSLGQLHRAAAGALLVGLTLGVTTVLPAEWGIDPTGVGGVIGLTAMGELKQRAPEPVQEKEFAFHTDEITLTLKPTKGTEVKAVMRTGDQLVYEWSTDGGELFYDFHGEPKGAEADVFTSYEKGTLPSSDGTFEAPFEGIHGWYWKNQTDQPVTVILKTSGVYQSITQK